MKTIKNERGQSLISVMVAMGIAGLLAMLLADLNTVMVRNNLTAMANSDILAYVNQLRSNIQYTTNSTSALQGQSMAGLETVLKDAVTGAVIAGPNYQQRPSDAWRVKYLRFDNVVSVPSQVNLFRGTLTAVFTLDNTRVIGVSVRTKIIGDVFCTVIGGVIQTCYGSTDLITMAQSNCAALGGTWDTEKAFGSQCEIKVAANEPEPEPEPEKHRWKWYWHNGSFHFYGSHNGNH